MITIECIGGKSGNLVW